MNEEIKYCKFCGKEKPIKDFVKSGFCVKNICKDCNNKKQKDVYKNSKNYHKLQQENQQLKEQLEASGKARKEASNILKDYIPDEYIRSCDTSDGIGRYELDTESWQYKIYEILDIDKGE